MTKTQIIKEPNQGEAMKRDSPYYGLQTQLIFNLPLNAYTTRFNEISR